MSRFNAAVFLAVCVVTCLPAQVLAENWPCWRGPRGDGTSLEDNAPVRWDGASGENVVWKVPLPGHGYASPIVWEDRIFVVSCIEEKRERILVCLDRKTGEVLWQRTVLTAPLEKKHKLNSFASSTPATAAPMQRRLRKR